ncbi:hypothetical protein [Rhizobium tubonense]|uniref:Uncharacterized protein n=1 Tax=Rhizobium tubonense TaxID=484088 RepID=A0A2W4CS52_9HYPH|nr:hypothetical protein [Rhizobium tubonense]PZM08244.1 hypothetical protein CPY51_29465 [Rhizobium tubonense]
MTQIGPVYPPKPFEQWAGKVLMRLRAITAPRWEHPPIAPIREAGAELPDGSISIEELKARGKALQVRLDAARALLQAYEL